MRHHAHLEEIRAKVKQGLIRSLDKDHNDIWLTKEEVHSGQWVLLTWKGLTRAMRIVEVLPEGLSVGELVGYPDKSLGEFFRKGFMPKEWIENLELIKSTE